MAKRIYLTLSISLLLCISLAVIATEEIYSFSKHLDFNLEREIEKDNETPHLNKVREIDQFFSTENNTPYITSGNIKLNNDDLVNPAISALTNYNLETQAYTWYDAVSSGTNLFINGDDTYGSVTLPFSFPFYDNSFSTVYVSSNGYLSFSDSSPTRYSNPSFPSSISDSLNVIALFWDDLRAEDNIYSWSTSNYVVIGYDNYRHLGGATAGTFEVVLKADGDILLNYQSISSDYGSTVGVNYGDGILATAFTNGLGSTSSFSLLFTQKIERIEIIGAKTRTTNRTSHMINWRGYPTFNTSIDHFDVKVENNSIGNTTQYFWNLINLNEGRFNITVHMILNDTSELVDWIVLIVDLTSPIMTIISPVSEEIITITNKTPIIVSWEVIESYNNTMTYYIEYIKDTSWKYLGITSDTSISIKFPSSGEYLLRIRGFDLAGNSDSVNISIQVEIPTIAIIASHGENLPVELINFYGAYYNIEIIYGTIQYSLLDSRNLIIVPNGGTFDWTENELSILTKYLRTNGNLLVFSSNPFPNWDKFLEKYGIKFISGEPFTESLSIDIESSHQLCSGLNALAIPAGNNYLSLNDPANPIGFPQNISYPILGTFESGERILAISVPLDVFVNEFNNSKLFLNIISWANEDRNHYPSVALEYPNGNEKVTKSITINWTATDPDDDVLSFMLEFWNGSEWNIISGGMNQSEYQWDIKNIPDGIEIYKIRVTASDGFLTDSDTSDDYFSIVKKITSPPNILLVVIPIMIISGVVLGIGVIYYRKFSKQS